MRIPCILFFAVSVQAAEFRFVNLTGAPVTNDSAVFAPGLTCIPMDAHSLTNFPEVGADGTADATVYFDAAGETVLPGDKSPGWYFWTGFIAGLSVGGFAFTLRVVRQMGRSSPEL